MSKPNEQVFTGTSIHGNLQEALDNAIAQLGHGGPWRLASIDGVQGIVPEVNVRIFAVAGALTADTAARPGQPGDGAETRQGTVEKIPAGTLSFCQDGAEYELVYTTPEGKERLRLRAANGRAGSVLKRFADTGEEVSVTGPVSHVECTVMDVVEARPVRADADAPQAESAAGPSQPGGGEPHTTQQGTVEVIANPVSICQDGAEYELVSTGPEGEERLRLRAANGRAGSVLKRFAGTGEEVSVTGPVSHVECTVMDVVQAHPVRAAAGSPQG